jgi:hypothetical protein
MQELDWSLEDRLFAHLEDDEGDAGDEGEGEEGQADEAGGDTGSDLD